MNKQDHYWFAGGKGQIILQNTIELYVPLHNRKCS